MLSPGQVGFMNGWGVFSTLRVCSGVLFAFERHYRRMKHDAALMHVPFEFEPDVLRNLLESFITANHAIDATLRVSCVRNKGGMFQDAAITRDADLIAFTTDLNEWGTEARLMSVPNGRHAASPFAGTKVTSWAQNLTFYETAHQKGFDETILLNERGEVSECTSANIFMMKGDSVWTPPLKESGCLPGVTRAILLEEKMLEDVHISERSLLMADLHDSDGVFITSTTRDLLAVSEIDHVVLPHNTELLSRLRNAFVGYREKYVAQCRQAREAVMT